ncbi:hypothetical protein P7K49_038843 [Saguinus oedipus]|uniref:NXF1/2/3/5-like leucine-rich repeat domain-containing protein n=1 Tax=Saguinus oedipus TaxID=9490 RepID=A0ABQ9TFT4_SAGOE|nr:hypothetical protein P7K49_038843 [Saguinus oedipus]
MDKRYDVSQQALDLQNLRFDPDLTGHDIDIILNRRNCMAATLKIIESNFSELLSLNLCNNKLYQLDGLSDITEKAPKVKILNLSRNELRTVWELSKVKGLKLEELWLEGNPLCDNFSDESAYDQQYSDASALDQEESCGPGPHAETGLPASVVRWDFPPLSPERVSPSLAPERSPNLSWAGVGASLPHAGGRGPGWLLSCHLFLWSSGRSWALLEEKPGFKESGNQKWSTFLSQHWAEEVEETERQTSQATTPPSFHTSHCLAWALRGALGSQRRVAFLGQGASTLGCRCQGPPEENAVAGRGGPQTLNPMLSWGLTLHSSWEKVSCPRGCSVSHAQLRLSSHSAIQNRFPKLLRLDGRELSPAMTVDMDSSELMKPCKVRKKDQARFGVL